MINELLLVITLIAEYTGVLFAFKIFGRKGLFAWVALATVLANIEVLVLVDAFGTEMTLGNILFASTFLATDIISENFGKRQAKQAVAVGIMSSIAFAFISATWVLYIPSANDVNSQAIHEVFTKTPRVIIASVVVYAIVQCLDVYLYHLIWEISPRKLRGKSGLWIRNNGATIISQIVNAVLYNVLAFWGIYPIKTLISIITSNVLIYIVTSLADTPFLYMARLKKDEKNSEELKNK